jgi:hypothetical protein
VTQSILTSDELEDDSACHVAGAAASTSRAVPHYRLGHNTRASTYYDWDDVTLRRRPDVPAAEDS